MAIRTHYVEQYPPRSISKEILSELVATFDQFKPGLSTSSRKLKARAISPGKITDLDGPECWKVVDPHSLAELEHVHVELLLVSNDAAVSCEIHIEFRPNHVALSVSDIQTGWGKAVFEEGKHVLAGIGVSSEGWRNTLRRFYTVIEITQHTLMVLGAALFALWLKTKQIEHLYGAVGFFTAGVVPTVRSLLNFLHPPRRVAVLEVSPPKRSKFPWFEASAVLTFGAAVLSLAKEAASLLATK